MTKYDSCLKWFKGKSLERAVEALKLLAESEAAEYWLPGHSRKVEAALNKCNVAHKFAKANEKLLKDLKGGDEKPYALNAGFTISHAMMFGHTRSAGKVSGCIDTVKRNNENLSDEVLKALETAESWVKDFWPACDAMIRLDATRPKPFVLFKTLSPTVLKNVNAAMGLDLSTVEPAPIVMKKKLATDAKGNLVYVWEPEVVWPEGTRHNLSKFSEGTAHNAQCHACGHAIKNAFNWVPLLAKDAAGLVSLWVGKDCASNLFGCEVKNWEMKKS